jgi:hypothetical protein
MSTPLYIDLLAFSIGTLSTFKDYNDVKKGGNTLKNEKMFQDI